MADYIKNIVANLLEPEAQEPEEIMETLRGIVNNGVLATSFMRMHFCKLDNHR